MRGAGWVKFLKELRGAVARRLAIFLAVGAQRACSLINIIKGGLIPSGRMVMKNFEPEDVWLRLFLRRLRLGLRNAKSTDTVAVLKELIAETEERLDRLERGDGHTPPIDLTHRGC